MDKKDVNSYQVGGSHYAEGGNCQHWDFIAKNGIGYLEGAATKYVLRWRKKHGINDLHKAVHFIQKLRALLMTGDITPHIGPLLITVNEFAAANKLNATETEITRLLTHWKSDGALALAQKMVEDLITAEE